MEKSIKEVLHLYIGNWVTISNVICGEDGRYILSGDIYHWIMSDYCKLESIELRRLSSMSEEDGVKIFGSRSKYLLYRKEKNVNPEDLFLFTPKEYKRLLEEGFWLFSPDAFDKGLIIDRDTLK